MPCFLTSIQSTLQQRRQRHTRHSRQVSSDPSAKRSVQDKSLHAHQIPDDVLRLIFIAGHSETAEAARLRFALAVASVCIHWRLTALSLPALWSTVQLTLSHRARSNSKALQYLQACLLRSNPSPINIIITTVTPPRPRVRLPPPRAYSLHDVVDVVFAHVDRLCMLSVAHPDCKTVEKEVLERLPTAASSLRSISIVVRGHNPTPSDDARTVGALRLRGTFPGVRRLVMDPVSPWTLVPSLDERFPSLESLTLGMAREKFNNRPPVPIDEILYPLRHLRFLHIHDCFFFSFPQNVQGSRVLFERLELLEHKDPPAVVRILRFIDAPRLTRVRLALIPDATEDLLPFIWEHSAHFPLLETYEIVADATLWMAQLIAISHAIHLGSSTPGFFSCIRLLGVTRSQLEWSLDRFLHCTGALHISAEMCLGAFPSVTGLRIVDREGACTPSAIRKLVENRQACFADAPYHRYVPGFMPLQEVHIKTQLSLSEEDRNWFQRSLAGFSWDDLKGSAVPDSQVEFVVGTYYPV